MDELKNFLDKNSNELYTIDRFEDSFVVCENRNTGELINVPTTNIPSNAKEGDILKLDNNKYVIDGKQTNNIENNIDNKFNKLF